MRRGLIQWDKHEYAAERIDAHIAAARKLLDERQLDAVVAYTDHSRPTTVWTFTQYVPYWATGAVIISRAHPSALVLTLSKRGLEWVKSVCRADYFTTGPSLPGGIRHQLAGQRGHAAAQGGTPQARPRRGVARIRTAGGGLLRVRGSSLVLDRGHGRPQCEGSAVCGLVERVVGRSRAAETRHLISGGRGRAQITPATALRRALAGRGVRAAWQGQPRQY